MADDTLEEKILEVNNGKGLFDKFGMVDEMLRKIEALADAKGVFRCGLIWDIAGMLTAMRDGLKKEDEATKHKINELKRMIENKEAE
jgi:hypothetical protein